MNSSSENEQGFNLQNFSIGKLHFSDDEDDYENKKANIEDNLDQEDVMNDETIINNEFDDSSDNQQVNLENDDNLNLEYDKPIINQNLNLNKCKMPNSKNEFNNVPVTPALIKRKQIKPWFNSPTDAVLSPCTQRIFKSKKPI